MMGKKGTNALAACFCTHTHTHTGSMLPHSNTHICSRICTHTHTHTHTHICRHRFRTHREAAGNVARTQYALSMITHTQTSYLLTHKCAYMWDMHTNSHKWEYKDAHLQIHTYTHTHTRA